MPHGGGGSRGGAVEHHQTHGLLARRDATDHREFHHVDGYDLIAARHGYVGGRAVWQETRVRLRPADVDALHLLALVSVEHKHEGFLKMGDESVATLSRAERGLDRSLPGALLVQRRETLDIEHDIAVSSCNLHPDDVAVG